MQHTAHTPGPWHAECEEGNHCGFIHNANGEDEGRGICDMRESKRIKHADKRRADSWVISAEDVANARLIAAAPDMLKALEFVLADLNSTLDAETALIVQHAINQAKGA